MNVLSIILLALFCAIGGYIIGLRRGITSSQHLYEDGWIAAEEYFKRFPELLEDEDDEDKYDKARELIRQLDELFDDEEDEDIIIGGDEY